MSQNQTKKKQVKTAWFIKPDPELLEQIEALVSAQCVTEHVKSMVLKDLLKLVKTCPETDTSQYIMLMIMAQFPYVRNCVVSHQRAQRNKWERFCGFSLEATTNLHLNFVYSVDEYVKECFNQWIIS